MTLIIRHAESDDRPAMLRLWVTAWRAAMPNFDFEARVPWLDERLDAMLRDGVEILVAIGQHGLAGFVTVDRDTQYLDQLATAVDAQRRGIGRRLLRAAKLTSPSGLSLKVNQANLPAIGLYRAEGFVVTGESVSENSGLPLYEMRWPGEPSAMG